MRLRERLRLLLHRFERALTRVEDGQARIEQGVDNIQDLMVRLHTAVDDLRTDVIRRDADRTVEIASVKKDLVVLQKSLRN